MSRGQVTWRASPHTLLLEQEHRVRTAWKGPSPLCQGMTRGCQPGDSLAPFPIGLWQTAEGICSASIPSLTPRNGTATLWDLFPVHRACWGSAGFLFTWLFTKKGAINPLPACARLTPLLPHKRPHVSPAQEWCNLAPQAFQDILGCLLQVKGAFVLE